MAKHPTDFDENTQALGKAIYVKNCDWTAPFGKDISKLRKSMYKYFAAVKLAGKKEVIYAEMSKVYGRATLKLRDDGCTLVVCMASPNLLDDILALSGLSKEQIEFDKKDEGFDDWHNKDYEEFLADDSLALEEDEDIGY